MSQCQLSVREPLAAYAEQQAQARGFTGVSAFVEHLLEADRREASRMQIEQALAEGLASESIEITPDWWAKRRELIASIAPESAS
jgi:hypothetical protein